MTSGASAPLKEGIIRYARETLGFDDCRFTSPFVNEHLDSYRAWLKEKMHGEMAYLEEHLRFKEHPEELLPGVRSAVVVIKNYKNTEERRQGEPLKIARFAAGKDYHQVMTRHLNQLADFIMQSDPSARCYCGSDSRPIAERTLALKAGTGFLGKNSMVIKPGLGSYFFIGVVLTTAALDEDRPLEWNCGQCRLCLDACPTQAFTGPYRLDATRCISYMTIEQKIALSPDELSRTKGWLFGCDVCQEVCPYNHGRTPLTDWKEFQPESGVGFKIFAEAPDTRRVPKDTPLYRSRKRLVPNWTAAKKGGGSKDEVSSV